MGSVKWPRVLAGGLVGFDIRERDDKFIPFTGYKAGFRSSSRPTTAAAGEVVSSMFPALLIGGGSPEPGIDPAEGDGHR